MTGCYFSGNPPYYYRGKAPFDGKESYSIKKGVNDKQRSTAHLQGNDAVC